MDQLISLYRILISVSAGALFFGLILMSGRFVLLRNSQKQLFILAVVNLLSMALFLFGFRALYDTDWRELILFIETLVLVLNMIVAYFIQRSVSEPDTSFAQQVKQLFLISFVSVCVYFSVYYLTGGQGSLLDKQNSAFVWIYGLTMLLFVGGSLLPGVNAMRNFMDRSKAIDKRVSMLLIINAINNLVGLGLFIPELPNKSISVVLNIASNLLFGYMLAYYFLSEFFTVKPLKPTEEPHQLQDFNWTELSEKLSYWNDAKAYLLKFYPDLVDEVDAESLSDLEKTHYALKRLNIKTKDIANAMSVSVRAVEMQRYRIKKKLQEED